MKKHFGTAILVFAFIHGYVFAACAGTGSTFTERYREKDKAGNGKDSLSEQNQIRNKKENLLKILPRKEKPENQFLGRL